ncbi:MAG: PKD domain-containing protein [Salinivirgaceae bacterium]
MKLFLVLLLAGFSLGLNAQEWGQTLPQDKMTAGELTFPEIQKAFYEYVESEGIVDGKKEVNGTQVKVPGWKQFKRWEWYWESRVNPVSGEFPETSASDEFAVYLKNHPATKSPSGNWTAVGPSSSTGGYAGVGRVNCVAFHPTDNNTFWIGTPSGGLWKTSDGGATWVTLTDQNAVLGVSDIAIPADYETSNTLYIATGDRDGGSVWSLGGGASSDNNSIGVLKSTDAGSNWTATGLTYAVADNKKIGRLLINPDNPAVLLAGTSDGISRSVDGGATWTSVYSGDYIIDMEFKPGNPDVVYASNMDYWGNTVILKSDNGGASWLTLYSFLTTDYRVEIAVTPHDADYIYAIVANRNSGLTGIYRSIDGGATFGQLINGNDNNKSFLGYYSDGSGENNGQGSYDLSIAVSPSNKNLVIIGGINSWKTTDGGATWNICNMWTSHSSYNFSGAPVAHADKHVHAFRSDGTLFEGNDGGIYLSTDNGTTWVDKSNGLMISQIYRLGVSQTDANVTITGLQDNGSKLFYGTSWYDVTGGDGMECIVDYTDVNTQYATYVNGEIYRTTNLWNGVVTISDNIADEDKGAWVTPYIIDPNNNSTLYVGYADVWKTTDKGASFTKISTMNTADLLRSMAIAPSNSQVLYVADFSNIWKTTNGGTSWTDITGSLPVISNNITSIAVKANNENTLWVTMGGYDTQRVFESTNGGSTWTNVSAGLPNLPIMSIVQNKLSESVNHLYVGTDVGVYFKNGTENWQFFSNGLPNVVVTELDIYYDLMVPENSRLRAATYGRGLWESDLFAFVVTPPTADFTVSEGYIQQGQSVTFTDLSTGATSWNWSFPGGVPAASTEQNPTVTYPDTGDFEVSLTVSNSGGSDTETKAAFIQVYPTMTPGVGFSASVTRAYVNQAITFIDSTRNLPTSWSWTFESGTPNTSTEQNPVVTYIETGTFDVTLTATNSAGSDSFTQTDYITIENKPELVVPTNLNATTEGRNVFLTWDKPNTETLIAESFESGSWPPTDWQLNHSLTLDGEFTGIVGTSWFQYDEDTYSGGPYPEYIHSGSYSAAIDYTALDFSWLISPAFTVDLSTVLQYWVWYYSDASSNYITKLHVLIGSQNHWTVLKSYGEDSPNNEFETMEEFSLSDFVGNTVHVAFAYEFNDGYQLMIDDVFVGSQNSGYNLFRDESSIAVIADPEILAYVDSSLVDGSYNYQISAYYGEAANESALSDMVSVTVNTSSVEESRFWNNRLSVFPNPASEKVKLSFDNSKAEYVSFRLYNLQGRKVFESEADNALTIQKDLDVSKLPAGNYLLRVTVGTKMVGIKLLVD